MEKELNELWKRRLFNQKFPLIGTNEPGKGNGFNDRISFDTHYYRLPESNLERKPQWLYDVYFRDISNQANPRYKKFPEQFDQAVLLTNCSDQFKETLYNYLYSSDTWRHTRFADLVGNWVRDLIYNGRVLKEFVSWMDNSTNDFYAYQLHDLDAKYSTIKKKVILYDSPFIEQSAGLIAHQKVEIPKNKVLIMEWPLELGGYKFYEKRINEITALGSGFPSASRNLSEPGKYLENQKKWKIDFTKLVSIWGTNHPLEETTEYCKNYNYFILRKTIIACISEVITGIQQLVDILNIKLNEKAKLSFEYEPYNIDKFNENFEKWKDGTLSFKEANNYLSFY